jgi:hypothetical protein
LSVAIDARSATVWPVLTSTTSTAGTIDAAAALDVVGESGRPSVPVVEDVVVGFGAFAMPELGDSTAEGRATLLSVAALLPQPARIKTVAARAGFRYLTVLLLGARWRARPRPDRGWGRATRRSGGGEGDSLRAEP